MIHRPAILSALTALTVFAGAALAQTATVPVTEAAPATAPVSTPAVDLSEGSAAWESARNQLGVLSYCQGKGFIGSKAVETQTRLLALIPAGEAGRGDAAESLGKAGTVSAMGVERSLSDAAVEQKTTEEALCKQMDALLQQLAAQIPT